MRDPEHWLFATIVVMIMGLPILYFTTKLGVASGIQAFYKRLDGLRNELHEMKGELEQKINQNWNFVRTVNGNVGRLEDRVSRLEGDTGEE